MEFLNNCGIWLIICHALITISHATMIYSCTEPNTIALTFDDGPFIYTKELVDILNSNNIKATFFINVENYWTDLETNPKKQEYLKYAFKNGHQIASHTWQHKIPQNHKELTAMMDKTSKWLEKVIGEQPKYFRAPKGECDDICIKNIETLGYKVIQWDTDTNDWNVGKRTKAEISNRVKTIKVFFKKSWKAKKSNYLVLMHDVYEHTVRKVIPWLVQNKPLGYKFVTVAECLGQKNSMYASGHAAETRNITNVNNATNTTNATKTTNTTNTTNTTIVNDSTSHQQLVVSKSSAYSNTIKLWSLSLLVSIVLTLKYW